MEKLFSTREEWLTMALDEFNHRVFKQRGFDLDSRKLKISCGFPPGQRGTKAAFAVLNAKHSRDGNTEIFVNPSLADELAVSVVAGLAAARGVNAIPKDKAPKGVPSNFPKLNLTDEQFTDIAT